VISTHSGFVLGSLDAGEPVARADVDAIVQAAAKASSVTSQLLAFGRRQIRQPRVLDLNALVLETHQLLAGTMSKEIRIGLELEASLAPVKADPTQIEQVLVNLAINAADAMPSGGELTIRTANVSLPVAVDDTPEASHVMLAVADTGCGMDGPTKARMFEPFFSTKESKGTGLGLASVYGIVAQSGGSIEVESEPGAGSTMRVYLPAVASEPEQTAAPPVPPERRTPATVLLVDDEDLVRTAARRLLATSGYAVLEAFDALEALQVAQSYDQSIDVLVTDLVMPGMGGRELADRLLADRPDLAVVFMSGYSDQAVTSLAACDDDVRFVHKPFTHEKLLGAIRTALGHRDASERGILGAATRS
jgi:two-component system cell cycle sensor histidine kinase/response regulator CckA